MQFQNFACWDIGRTRDVMNTNAELASSDIFMAVHSEYPLTAVNPREGPARESTDWTLKPDDFLQRFLSDVRTHMQVAILGDSGSGKSHLIRWMELAIPKAPHRHVISIPRAGISLRGIIELILEVLPVNEAQPYRDRLNQAGDERSTPDQLEERLLSALALAIREDERTGSEDPDLEAELIAELPNIFNDPYLRAYFRNPGGVIGQLATQVLSASDEYLPATERREFAVGDLPLTGIQTKMMSAAAGQVCDFLRSDPDVQRFAIEIINRNLDRAIGQVLNFTGDRLTRLLSDVRCHLRNRGQELILLIEDLARLQGLDLSLLEALIEEGNEDNGLCSLRWATAVTTGYYSRIPDTVKTRMNFVLDMCMPMDTERGLIDEDAIVSFSAKYLNAVRLDPETLKSWAMLPEEQRGDTPVACSQCPHRTRCHEAFGALDGVGLYPFNRDALLNMLRRLDSRVDERFNPRVLVKDVLAEVLGTYGRDLEKGSFPSDQLLGQMGGRTLAPIVLAELTQQDPDCAHRQLAVLELWGEGGRTTETTVTDLPDELYYSFGLTKPAVSAPQLKGVPRPEQATGEPAPAQPDRYLNAIRDWGNGGSLQDNVLNYIRPLVYDSVVMHIDWDIESLVQAQFAHPSNGPFRRDSISFQNQLTQVARRPVTLRIPTEGREGATEAALAVEALHRFRQHQNWDFPHGPRLMVALGNCLDTWSNAVLTQLRRLDKVGTAWDPGAAAVEMLAIGAALAGRPVQGSDTVPDWLNALFEAWPQEPSARSPKWRTLYRSVQSDQQRLKDIALARASGTKGGQRGTFIDPSKLLPPLRSIRRRWVLTQCPPDQSDAHGRLYSRLAAGLGEAAADEWRRRTGWALRWRKIVPDEVSAWEVMDGIRKLLELALGIGIRFSARSRDLIDSLLQQMESVQLDDALRAAASLLDSQVPVEQLPELGRDGGGGAGEVVEEFLSAVDVLLNELEASTAIQMQHSGQEAKDLQHHQHQIEEALEQLSESLSVIGEGYARTH